MPYAHSIPLTICFSKEVDATEIMIERVAERFALKPDHVAGDVAYGTGEMLGWPMSVIVPISSALPLKADVAAVGCESPK